MYSLYLDRPTEFVCEVQVKNANLKGAFARMIVKSDDLTLLYEGKIENGKCIITIGRLKGLLDENSKGKMKLEVVVEDLYFSPWNDDFSTEQHTAVKVKIDEQIQPIKPVVTVNVPSKPCKRVIRKGKITIPIREAIEICFRQGLKKKKDILTVLKSYLHK